MTDISLAYTEATRTLALVSADADEGNAGTTADTGTVNVTVTGIPAGWAAQLDFDVRVRDARGRVMKAYQVLDLDTEGTTGTLTIDNAVLYATILDGKLPVQLVLTDVSNSLLTASRNLVVLDVSYAIDAVRNNIRAYVPDIIGAFAGVTISNGIMLFTNILGTVVASVDIFEEDSPVHWSDVLLSTESWVSDDAHIPTAKAGDARFAKATDLSAHVDNVSNPHAVTKAQVGLGNCDNTSDADKPVSTAQAAVIAAHADRTDNPHAVTKAQVGLGNADNTSDLNKPISTATQTALGLKANASDLGTAATKDTGTAEGNIPILGTNGKLADGVLPPIAINEYAGPVDTKADLITLTTTLSGRATGLGDWANVTSESGDNVGNNGSWILAGSDPTVLANWTQMYAVGGEGGTVYSVNGHVGIVVLTKSDVGLDNCDNTSDLNKPISTLTQAALDAKATTEALTAHIDDTSNPHAVTKAQVGLGNCDDTSDANKPVSTATQTALDAKQPNLTAGANVSIVDNVISAEVADLPGGIEQTFWLASSSAFSDDKPASDVSADIELVGTTATQTDFTYTPALESTFDTSTSVYCAVRFTGLTAGIAYAWRPILKVTIGETDTTIAEIALADAITFTTTDTTYFAYVKIPLAITASLTVPASSVFTFSVRLVKQSGTDTVTVYLATDIASGAYVYVQRSGGFLPAAKVYDTEDGTVKTQAVINAECKTAIALKATRMSFAKPSTGEMILYIRRADETINSKVVIDSISDESVGANVGCLITKEEYAKAKAGSIATTKPAYVVGVDALDGDAKIYPFAAITPTMLTNAAVSWAADSTYSDYSYKGTVTAAGCAASGITAVVEYSPADSVSGDYSPFCIEADGAVYIWSTLNTLTTIEKVTLIKNGS